MNTLNETSAAPKRGRPLMQERQRQMREDAILDAARDLLAEKGYSLMTLEDVIESVGISKPTFYQHFRSKEELALSVVLRGMNEIRDYMDGMDSRLTVGERLVGLTRWVVEKRFQTPGLRLSEFAHHIRSSGERDARYAEAEHALEDRIERLVLAGWEDGSLRTDVPALILSQTLIGAIRDEGFGKLLRDGKLALDDVANGLVALVKQAPL